METKGDDEDASEGESEAGEADYTSLHPANLNNEEPITSSVESPIEENYAVPLPVALMEMDKEDNVSQEPAANMIETMRTDEASPLPASCHQDDVDLKVKAAAYQQRSNIREDIGNAIETMRTDEAAPLPAAQMDVMDRVTDGGDLKKDPESVKKSAHRKKTQIEQLATGPSPLPASSHQDDVDLKVKTAAYQQQSNTRKDIGNATEAAAYQEPSIVVNTREDISNATEAADGDLPRNEDTRVAHISDGLVEFSGTDRRSEIPQILVI